MKAIRPLELSQGQGDVQTAQVKTVQKIPAKVIVTAVNGTLSADVLPVN